MFELTKADVFRLVEMFTSSDLRFMQVRVDDVDLVLSRNDQDGVRAEPDAGVAPAPTHSPAGTAAGTAPPVAADPAGSAPPATEAEGSSVTVDASSLGTFYRSPRPDLPPYVEVGTTVAPDTTVCLIEAMKVFTGVAAGVRGTVSEVLVEDGQFVEYGQPLFRIRLAGTDSAVRT